MEEWKEYKLGEVVNILDYKRVPLSSKERSTRKGNYPYYGAQGIIDYIDDYIFDGTYLLIAEDGENLKSQKQNIAQLATGKYWVNNHAHIVESNGLCDIRYLCYLLNTMDMSGYITGSAQPKLNQANMSSISIVLPSITVQKRIADFLSRFDDKIEVNRRINDNLEQQAQALFKSWLAACHEEVTIGDLSENITDYTKCNNPEVVLINSSDVTEGFFEHHNLSENKNLKGHFKKRFQKGDILYSQVRPRNRHWGYCTFNADNYLASTQLMVIRNRPDVISSILLYQYIIEDKVWMDFTLRTETRSGTFPQGNYEDLSAIKVPFGANVKEISDNLENIYSLNFKNEQESRRLAELRDTLLPRLMSGELRVPEE